MGGLGFGSVLYGLISSEKALSIKGCTFTNCGINKSSDGIGGIIYGYGEGKLLFENNTINNELESIEYGGGIYADGVFNDYFFI
jgi:hypothetical protein